MTIRNKLILIACFILTMVLVSKFSGLDRFFNLESLQQLILGSGFKGVLIYIGLFTVGTFMSLPGMLFVVVAFVVYGSATGSLIAYLGALTAVTVNFLVVRKFGGSGLDQVQKPWVQKLINKLETNPLRSMVILRSIFWIAPPLNYTLALSPLGSKNYFIGTAVGLLVPMSLITGASYLWMDELIRLIS